MYTFFDMQFSDVRKIIYAYLAADEVLPNIYLNILTMAMK